jgi:hypothetical protein
VSPRQAIRPVSQHAEDRDDNQLVLTNEIDIGVRWESSLGRGTLNNFMPEHAATLETAANIAVGQSVASCPLPFLGISVALNAEPEIEATKKCNHLVTGGARSQRCMATPETGLHIISSSIRRQNGA